MLFDPGILVVFLCGNGSPNLASDRIQFLRYFLISMRIKVPNISFVSRALLFLACHFLRIGLYGSRRLGIENKKS